MRLGTSAAAVRAADAVRKTTAEDCVQVTTNRAQRGWHHEQDISAPADDSFLTHSLGINVSRRIDPSNRCARPAIKNALIGEPKRVGRSGSRSFRALAVSHVYLRMGKFAVALLACCLAGTEARACFSPADSKTIFFDETDLTAGIVKDASTVIEVKIIGVRAPAEKFYSGSVGRVERVIRGTLPTETIRILWLPTSCDRELAVGDGGIVAGNVRTGSDGVLELIAVAERVLQRMLRKRGSGN
jgi:hypothetical protein